MCHKDESIQFFPEKNVLYPRHKELPKAVTYSIHNLASKIGNFGLIFVHFFGFLILDGVSYSIQVIMDVVPYSKSQNLI